MTALQYAILLTGGMLVIWLAQINGFTEAALVKAQSALLSDLVECDLCLGVWIYAAIGLIWVAAGQGALLTETIPALLDWTFYVALSTYTAHLLRYGFMKKFGRVEL